jgi:hypothetical protein
MSPLLAIAWLSLVGGCGGTGPALAPVTGKVTVAGAPLTSGTVNFESVDRGFAAPGVLQSDGTYKVRSQHGDGLPIGRYRVSITPPPGNDPLGGKKAPPSSPIPEKYRSFTTSGLDADVRPGAGPFNFELSP